MFRRVVVGKPFEFSISMDDNSPESKVKSKATRRKVVVGKEFKAKVSIDGKPDVTDEIRSRIVWAVIGLSSIFLFVSGALGIYHDDFSHLSAVWNVIGPIYGGLAGYFFPHGKK